MVAIGGAVAVFAGVAGWAGAWLTVVGGVTVLAGVGVGAWDEFASRVGTARAGDKEDQLLLQSLLRCDPTLVSQVDPTEVGVFRSGEAIRLATETPPYVPRDFDPGLDAWIRAGGQNGLVVVAGSPKSGKSRTAWEALIRCRPSATVLAVRLPYRGDDNDTGKEPLTALSEIAFSPEKDIVVWVDDAHEHLGRGLTRSNLVKLRSALPEVLFVFTIWS